MQDSGTAKEWPKSCNIARPCPSLKPLKRCPPDIRVVEASTITSQEAPGTIGSELFVRGRLGLFNINQTAVHCNRKQACCNRTATVAFLGDPPHGLYLAPHGCFGDESRRCCTVPAFGQEVIAKGTLYPLGDPTEGVFWHLKDTSLCVEDKGAARDAPP